MFGTRLHTWAVATTSYLATVLMAASAHGGVITDWLCGGSPAAASPVVSYYGPTSSCIPCNPCDCCNPCACYPVQAAPCTPTVQAPTAQATIQPTPIYIPPTATPAASPSTATIVPPPPTYAPQPPRINPVPQTYYRTVWKQVPVTTYRPVVSTDPVTGYRVTAMKPCSTYEWQAQRQREGWLRRLFRPLTQLWQSAPAATPVCQSAPVYCNPMPSACASGTYITPAPMPAVSGPSPTPAATPSVPYYQGATTPPGGVSQPPVGVAPPSLGTQPPSTSTPPAGATPADQAPSLKPADGKSVLDPQTTKKPATSSQPMVDLDFGNKTDAKTNSSGAALEPPRSGNLRLRPIPDPAEPQSDPRRPKAPELLNPRDRVAARPAVYQRPRAAIIWPAGHAAPANAPALGQRPSTPSQRQTPRRDAWDDSGWHTVPN